MGEDGHTEGSEWLWIFSSNRLSLSSVNRNYKIQVCWQEPTSSSFSSCFIPYMQSCKLSW